MIYDTGHWEIWIDDVDGELAMSKRASARRDVLVVEEEVFNRALADLAKAEELCENLKMVCRRLAAARTLESRNKIAKQCRELFKGSILRGKL